QMFPQLAELLPGQGGGRRRQVDLPPLDPSLRNRRVEEGEDLHPVALTMELLRHLEGDDSAKGRAPQQIRPARLHSMDFGEIGGGHLLDGGMRSTRLDVQARSLERIEGLVRSQMSRQIAIAQHTPADRMDAEEGSPLPL